MKKSIRIFLTSILTLIFLFSTGRYLLQQQDKALASSSYEAALQIAVTEPPEVPETTGPTEPTEMPSPALTPRWLPVLPEQDPHAEALEAMDLEALREVNPDVVGWILIPDTQINYPLMQGTDNSYYLERTWDKKSNATGSIFLEYLSNPELTDFNTILYGHNMNDGSMFAGIREYRNDTYWQEHPYIYIRSDQGVYRYEIFSSYLATVNSITFGLGFPGEEARSQFLDHALENSVIHTGIHPETTDRIITLSTCSGSTYYTRWVIHARLKMILTQA